MSYASLAEFKSGIPERDLVALTDLDLTAEGTVQDDRIQEALDDASAEIDSYIAKVVALPLAAVPRILKVVCRDLALHRLYVNIGHDMQARKSLRDEAIGYLKSVSRGEASLGDGGAVPAEIVSPGAPMIEGPERQMTRDGLKGF
ncbi:DUF1320 domain-containing protein [Rhodobacter sp. NTK016B]|uniref:gp436 family protein n=1 Tax=Rhodobacter sp. NTK016B TaxID=2759676 RepID=UPI001A8CB5B8|nr:DUF1320 domain-containing protein [Rhodobacter sp. NTK016B]MBN8294731.1 DUF1320 domain-containing protein [Rhodobacter sp. NTK016B]